MRIYLLLLLLILTSCKQTVTLDYNKNIIACTNIYDKKDKIIYYEDNKNTFQSVSTGVTQYTYIDVYGERKMLNEYEIDNYNCVTVSSQEQFNKIVNE
jgi:hypothetical protein